MARGKWFITPHAVKRYIQRVAPSLTYEEALEELVFMSSKARRIKEMSPGIALYRGGKPLRLRFRVAECGDGLPRLLTVMKGHDRKYIKKNGKILTICGFES